MGPATQFWQARGQSEAACHLCPHACILPPGQTGLCKIRQNEAGKLILPFYGAISSLAIDPIEKKPLHHFLPGSSVFSAGFLGCNLKCPFCQNWEISQAMDVQARRMSPSELVDAACRSGCPSIAYTYSEPLVHIEFVLESMRLAHDAGLRNVLVTNGCVGEAASREVLSLTDAVNVDLKCWSPEAYRRELGGDRDAVLAFIGLAASICHLEVTTLVVPGLSDSPEGIDSIAVFLAKLSPDIALHLSAYHPAWKHRLPPTSPALLGSLAVVARGYLRYVYIGNLAGEKADTRCPACGATLVRRRGYDTEILGLIKGEGGRGSRCSSCQESVPIILQ